MQPSKKIIQFDKLEKNDATFNRAAEIFRVMSAPMRLRIMSCLCAGEKNVSELLEEVDTTQSNMSQHLSTLFQAGILQSAVKVFKFITVLPINSLSTSVAPSAVK